MLAAACTISSRCGCRSAPNTSSSPTRWRRRSARSAISTGCTRPLILAHGTYETPEFQRQTRDFAAAVKAAGKPVELLVGEGYNHFEMLETLGNPYGLLGRAVLAQMRLQRRRAVPESSVSRRLNGREQMPQNITTSVRAMVEAAEREVETLAAKDAIELHGRDDIVLVDMRDIRELQREGRVPGAFHCPRGMLEFWIDPASSYHKPVFARGQAFVFFCAGGQRSALAAQAPRAWASSRSPTSRGGFGAWKAAGGPVEMPADRPKS